MSSSILADDAPKSRAEIRKLEKRHAALAPRSLAYYLEHVVINANPEPRRFGLIAEPWQRELIGRKVPMLEGLAGVRPHAGPWSFCDILARGHDKTSLEGRLATWLLLASRRPIQGYILAEDKDQGALVLDALATEARLNPWVDAQLRIVKNEVTGPGGKVEVVPADAGSAYGFRGNLFIFDEFCNWRKPKCKDVWTAVDSGTEKITPRVLGVVSNAGYYGSWQHAVYERFCADPDFQIWDKKGQLASWMSPERVAALKARLPAAEGRRLFDNYWIDVGEDAGYLTVAEAQACVDPSLPYRMFRQAGVDNYVLIVDYGPKRDRTVFLVAHADPTGRVVVDRIDVLTGTVAVEAVQQRIDTLIRLFAPARIVIDPYQMLGVIEGLRRRGQPVEEVKFRGGTLNHELCECLRTAVSHRRVAWYPGAGSLGADDTLETELGRLVTKRKEYGFRFDHEATGHDDRAFCLALAIHQCPGIPAA